MIRTEGLTKLFNQGRNQPSITAVEDLTLQVEEGEVFGFLGPNGAGKTTTVRMLACLIGMTRGRAWINGYEVGRDDQAIRQSVGLLTETPGMYDRLSAERNLTLFARLYNVSQPAARVEKYLRMLGLWDRRMDEVGSFSKGMRQKLAIARALLHEPRLVFLDEPTSGLDPLGRMKVREIIQRLKNEGKTVFFSSHELGEVETVCDRVAIINQGELKVEGRVADLVREHQANLERIFLNIIGYQPESDA